MTVMKHYTDVFGLLTGASLLSLFLLRAAARAERSACAADTVSTRGDSSPSLR